MSSNAPTPATKNEIAIPDEAPTIHSLVQQIVDRDPTPEVLHKALDLLERVEARDARKAFFEALGEFQEKVPEIRKSRTAKIVTRGGSDYGYTFAPLEEITRTIRPILKRCGLSYSWTVEPGNAGHLHVICILRHTLGHQEVAMFPVPTETAAAMSGAQKNGAALTYGKRQSLTSVLGLTMADHDTDGVTDPLDMEEIDDEELANLEELLRESGSDRSKFLDYFDLGMLSQMTRGQYPKAVSVLKRKIREAR